MTLLLTSRVTTEQIGLAAQDLDGYVKFVVDLKQKIMTIGSARQVQGKELLLNNGSSQQDLWSGGIDLESHQIDYDSMNNIRPTQGNTSREVLSQEIRDQMKKIVLDFLTL